MLEEKKEIQEYKHTEIESIDIVKKRIKLVNDLYKSILEKDQHYGKIPGTTKDTLYKAGAEKLTVLFKLVPKIEKENIEDLGNGHREYKITIGLYHKNNNECWGQAVGSCSTMESKYRYRNKEEVTDIKVDKLYWDMRNENNLNKYYGKYPDRKGLTTKKIDGIWLFIKKEGKVENENIADTYNTVYKMAYKRAFVSAVIIATGVSDIFTQDLEDNIIDDIKDVTPEKEIIGQEQKETILKMAEQKIELLKKDGKFNYFKDLHNSKKDYSQEQYLLDFQYLENLGKEEIEIEDGEIDFNDEHMQETEEQKVDREFHKATNKIVKDLQKDYP